MSRLFDRLRRSRLLAEVRFVITGALVGAGAGLATSLLASTRLAPGAAALDRYTAAVSGLGFGWWGGLLFSVALAVTVRRWSSPPPVRSLFGAVSVAAVVVVATVAIFLALKLAPAAGVPVGVAAGAVAARLTLRAAAVPVP
jgi:hypothetical protein